MSTMEKALQRLDKTEEKYQAELDAAFAQFRELVEAADTMDKRELHSSRERLQKSYTRDSIARIRRAFGDKYNLFTMIDAQRDVESMLEDAERKLIPQEEKTNAGKQWVHNHRERDREK